MNPRVILLLWAVAVAATALAAAPAAASWAVAAPRLPVEGAALGRDALFARIDSLESVVDDLDGDERAELQWRLAQLYMSTDMPKHRHPALDLLDEVAQARPDDPRPHWLWAQLAHAMRYDSAVRKRLAEAVERDPQAVQTAVVLATAELRTGLIRLNEGQLEASRRAWRHAVDLDSTRGEVWHGMAVSALALGEYRAARRAARSLTRHLPETGLALSAAAHQRLGEQEIAAARFGEALELMDEGERAVFLQGHGFLDGDDLELIAEVAIPRAEAFSLLREHGEDPRPGDEIDWELVLEDPDTRARVLGEWWSGFDERPAQDFSTGEVEYWSRLVEADALFGRPEDGVRGWHTPPGELWVRWGRPTSRFYDPGSPSGTSRIDALGAAGVRFPPDTVLPLNSPPIWVWTYRWPGTWISFLFTDRSRTNAWSPSESTRRDLADLNAQVPIRLARATRIEPFSLAVSAVAFPRSGAESVVETYVAFEPTPDLRTATTPAQFERLLFAERDTIAIVDWSVSTPEGDRIDAVRRVIGPEARRSLILDALGRATPRGAADPYLLGIGARLPAGRYRIGVEVREPVTGRISTDDFGFTVPEANPGDLLEMSGLHLAAAFVPWTPGQQIPEEFVKYATAVVPAPDHRVPAGTGRLGVYFEVRNLAVDEQGLNSFDVRYAVYRSNREIRDLAFQEAPDVDGLELVAPASLSFLDERTGTSPEGLVVKGTELDLAGLAPGDYVLVVTIRDRIANDRASRAASFRVSSP